MQIKNIFKTRRGIYALLATSTLLVTTAIATIAVVLVPKSDQNFYYQFDGKTFNTKEEMNEYLNNNLTYTTAESNNNFYLYDSTPYAIDSLNSIASEIESKNKITEHKTYRDVNKYIIDTSNQLSDNVVTNSNESIIDVYQGKNNNAYTNMKEAIDSYQNISKQYLINDIDGQTTIEFQNKTDAINYYQNIIRDKVESGVKTDKYHIAGLDMTKEQVMQWIGQTSSLKYKHNGFEWSPNNISNPENLKLTSADKTLIQKMEPLKNSYWLDYDSNGLSGTLSGPKYIETDMGSDDFQVKLYSGWQKTKSKDINALLSPLAWAATVINSSMNSNNEDDMKEWNIGNLFVKNSPEKIIELENLFESAYNKNFLKSSFKIEDYEKNLSKIDGMPEFEKNLVFLKNFYLYIITQNNNGKEDKVIELINFLKESLREYIESNTNIFKTEDLDILFKPETVDTIGTSNTEFNFMDIIDTFIDPNKFEYVSPSKQANLLNILGNINDLGDIVFAGDLEKIGDLTANVKANYDKIIDLKLKIALKQNDLVKYKSEEAKNKARDTIISSYEGATLDENTGNVSFKKTTDVKTLKMQKTLAGYNIASKIWQIGNLLSFLNINSYENDLGNGQILRYEVIGFKIPLIGITFDNEKFKDHITQTSIFKTEFLPKPVETTISEDYGYFIVMGSLFTSKVVAEEYLKNYIIQNPLKFVDTSVTYISAMSQQEEFEIELNTESDSSESTVEWQLQEQLDEFKEKIFVKYFASSAVKQFTDGFGNFFNNAADALHSMSQNLTYEKFVIKYKFIENNQSYYYETFSEAWEQQQNFIKSRLIKKSILNTSLINTTVYSELPENDGGQYSIYKVFFNGKNRYFATYDDAKFYMFNNSKIERIDNSTIYYELSFKGKLFTSSAEFYKWVDENTIIKGE